MIGSEENEQEVKAMEKTTKRGRVYPLAAAAVVAAVLCVVGPWSIPIGPVPLSLATLIISLGVYVLGAKLAAASVLVYLLLGAVGLPVFSNYGAGLAKVAGPTGGYLVGYLALALVGGWFVERFHGSGLWGALGLVLGTALLYAFGTAWFVVQMEGATIGYALGVCVVPFLVGDAAKIAISSVLGPLLRRRILAAGLLPSKASP